MAIDQGKNSNVAALAILADATGRGIPETGTTTPPCSSFNCFMGKMRKARGLLLSVLLLPTRHQLTVGPQIEAGLWYRLLFSTSGETNWRQSCDRS